METGRCASHAMTYVMRAITGVMEACGTTKYQLQLAQTSAQEHERAQVTSL